MTTMRSVCIALAVLAASCDLVFVLEEPPTRPLPGGSGKYVFVTSRTFQGDLGGLAGADAACQLAAMSANLPGIYQAWLSDGVASPVTRFTRGTNYRLVDGTVIARDFDDLTDGNLRSQISLDEDGMPPPDQMICEPGQVWTSTTAAGEPDPSTGHCNGWTSARFADNGGGGTYLSRDEGWTEGCVNFVCFSRLPLYCFEQ
jgi:hypothetical protein